jgi:hypothetical protein
VLTTWPLLFLSLARLPHILRRGAFQQGRNRSSTERLQSSNPTRSEKWRKQNAIDLGSRYPPSDRGRTCSWARARQPIAEKAHLRWWRLRPPKLRFGVSPIQAAIVASVCRGGGIRIGARPDLQPCPACPTARRGRVGGGCCAAWASDAAPQGFDAAKKVTGRRLRTSRAPPIGLSGLRRRNRRRQTKVVRLIVELAQDQRTADAAKSPCDFRATIGKK